MKRFLPIVCWFSFAFLTLPLRLQAAPDISWRPHPIPLGIQAPSNLLGELQFDLPAPETLTDLVLTLTSEDPSALPGGLWLTFSETKLEGVGSANHFSWKGSLDLPAGKSSLKCWVQAGDNGSLDAPFQVEKITTSLGVGDQRPVTLAEPWSFRWAYLLHEQGQFQCHTFRIPAIARALDGSLLAVYDMRYHSRRDLQEDIDIGLSRSTDGGRTWSDPRPIMDMGTYGGKPEKENGCSDPGILVDTRSGEILVSAVWTHGKPNTHQWSGRGSEPGLDLDHSAQFMVVRSRDHGKTWSAPENWTERLKNPAWYLFAPAPGNGITRSDGTLVMPTQGRDETGLPFSNITWSSDHGKTWTVSAPARSDTTENAVAELSDGTLMLNMRDNRNRQDKGATNGRAVSVTRDLGAQWTVHPSDHGALPEPVCMASLIAHREPGGRHLLFFSNPRNKNARAGMTIQTSLDDGLTWPEAHRLLLDQKGGAYSSLVMIDDQTLGILYESSRADFVFQRIPLKALGL